VGSLKTAGSSPRRVLWGLALLVLVALGAFAWQAVTAARALLDARATGETVQQLIRAGDFDGANRALDDLRSDTGRARGATDGVLWDLGRHVPFVGRNVGAVQTVSDVLDTATRVNAPIALELSRAVDEGRFRPHAQRIELAEIRRLSPSVRRAADSIADAADRLAATSPDRLVFPLNDLVGDLQAQVGRASSAATTTAKAFDLLPGMLGEKEPRTYLLVIQNPAELRSTGGLPGSLALLHAEGGRLTMGWQGSATDVGGPTTPAVALPRDTAQQYGPTPAVDPRDATFTPDFPEAAQILGAMVERRRDVKVDGVVAVDPVALAALMRGTGPVAVRDGIRLDAGNVVRALLNQTYQQLPDPEQQNRFFEEAARRIFDSVMSGQGDQRLAIRGLADAAGQHRVLVWSARDAEQGVIRGTAVSGSITGRSPERAEIGLYLNDSTAGKVDYYLQYRSSAAAVDCRRDGSQDVRVTLALTSTMPTDFGSLSSWILGTGEFAPRGTIAFNLRVYAPHGGQITALTQDGHPHSITADEHKERQVALLPVSLAPGQRSTITVDIRTAAGQSGDGALSFTPGIVPAPNGVRIGSACD
jgi:hypothetical protein